MKPGDPEKLEASIHRALRSVPDRRAPAGLEQRVRAELARRASQPWWRRAYGDWPLAVRSAFFVGSALAAAVVIAGLASLRLDSDVHSANGELGRIFAGLDSIRDIGTAVSAKALTIFRAFPRLWLAAIAGTLVACYASLAVIGAAAYRALGFGRPSP